MLRPRLTRCRQRDDQLRIPQNWDVGAVRGEDEGKKKEEDE